MMYRVTLTAENVSWDHSVAQPVECTCELPEIGQRLMLYTTTDDIRGVGYIRTSTVKEVLGSTTNPDGSLASVAFQTSNTKYSMKIHNEVK